MSFTAAEQEQISRIANNWRLTPATMATKLTGGGWIAAPWLQWVSAEVAAAIAQGNQRIIISAPPRHGKTELISIHTSTWVLENFPNKNVILTGYGADLVEVAGRRVRDQIRDNEGLLKCRIRQDVSKVNAFLTNQNGYMFSVGLGGAITGRGAHVLLIDDYIKEIKEALSPAHRDYIWNWFVTTAMTRLEPNATVIIIATRWHSDDLIGRVLKNFPGKWKNLCFPAFATKELDEIGRHKGDVLFEERYDAEFLEGQKELLGSVFFHALYQQGPMDEVMAFTNKEWLKKCKELPADDFKWARVWDLAATEEGGDWTCGTLCGYSKSTNNFVIGNVIRKQKSIGKVEELVRATAAADGLDVAICIEQEPGSSGKSLVNHYETTVLPEYKVIPVPAVKSKLIRAQPFLAACEAGKVYLHDQTTVSYDPDTTEQTLTWHNVFEKEFETFPGGENDDQIDTAAAGYVYLSGKKKLPVTWGRERNNEKTDHKTNSKAIRKASFMVARSGDINKRRSSVAFGRTI